jgi:hypothetical protein
MKNITQLLDLLDHEIDSLLNHICKTIPKEALYLLQAEKPFNALLMKV